MIAFDRPSDDFMIAYCGNPLDRAEDRRGDAAWLAEARTRGRFLVVHDGCVRVAASAPELDWLAADDVPEAADCVLLGVDGEGIPCFAVAPAAARGDEGVRLVDARTFALELAAAGTDNGASGIVAQALSILSWHARHRFCARCGAPTVVRRGGYQRFCESCRTEHFPRTDPVAIMLVSDGEHCLLGRQANWPERIYSALAGFIEAGESLEAAVRREVHEEAGIRVGRVIYVGSQPWPFPSNLMLGCLADAESRDITVDRAELEDARWFSREQIREGLAGSGDSLRPPPPIAIARHLMQTWLDAR